MQNIAISWVIASLVTFIFGTAPEIVSTSLSAARIEAMLGVIVGIIRYFCLKNTELQTQVLFVVGM